MLNGDYQGKGYAFEAAYAFFDYLFSEKCARRIYAYTEDNNFSSQHLCEKLGMRKEGEFYENYFVEHQRRKAFPAGMQIR
ncbi:Acetyltransferase (GNAT) domain-containing protein [Lachnospiraceae bacterium XBB1006]|nr:Acetyltransferase (GNAT) domain-containing protein [Lachnospiraceae bacterium XBB1006]